MLLCDNIRRDIQFIGFHLTGKKNVVVQTEDQVYHFFTENLTKYYYLIKNNKIYLAEYSIKYDEYTLKIFNIDDHVVDNTSYVIVQATNNCMLQYSHINIIPYLKLEFNGEYRKFKISNVKKSE